MNLQYTFFVASLIVLNVSDISAEDQQGPNKLEIRSEEEFIESAISQPKARLYLKENFTGDFEEPKNFGTIALECANLEKRNGTEFFFPPVKSIDTLGSCVRIYSRIWCEGLSLAIYPGSPHAQNLTQTGLQEVKSIGPCLQNEFENAKIVNTSDGLGIFKDPSLMRSFDVVPDEIPFFSPINTTTIYPQCGIIQQQRGYQNRVEFIKIAIDRETLRSEEAIRNLRVPEDVENFYGKLHKEEGDVLGWALPLELGGPMEDVNVFPIDQNVKEEYHTVITKVKGIFARNESIERVHFSVNFLYLNENSTRPDMFAYWIIEDYGEGANYYGLFKNTKNHGNESIARSEADQAVLETALTQPKGQIEFSREGNITDILNYDSTTNPEGPRCKNYMRFQYSNEVFTVKSFGTCIRLFEYSNCRGISVAIYPGSTITAKDVRTKQHDDYSTVVLSIGPCLPIEFEHAKINQLNGTTQILKDRTLTKNLTAIPDVLFDLSGDDRAANFVRCPIRQVSLKNDQIIEFMMTAIIKKHILPNDTDTSKIMLSSKVERYYELLDKKEGDVLGFALPLEFGGPMKPYNVFPQTLTFRNKLKQVFSDAAKLLKEGEPDQNPWVALTFLYGKSITRPNGVLYKIFNVLESPVGSGFIKN